MKYEPDYHRWFVRVLLIFSVGEDLLVFIEYLEGAHQGNRKKPPWQSPFIPNWPHLKRKDRINQRSVVQLVFN